MVTEGHSVVIREQPGMLTPAEVVEGATTQAKLLMDIVEKTKCYQQIANKKYLQVEAWETIGAFNRTHSETNSVAPIVKDGETIGYQAHVQLWKDGSIVGGAMMPCYFSENCCKGKEGDAKHKACMSAAQTFATSKAYRMNFSYVAILAGYQPMPAEEITEDMAPIGNTKGDTEHWCTDHQTNFFMRGKMKSYAHPIKDTEGNDTGEWCHEHKDKSGDGKDSGKKPLSIRVQFGKELLRITGKTETKLTLADVDQWLVAHEFMGADSNKPIWGQLSEEAQGRALAIAKAEAVVEGPLDGL
jgi:hypothetical protein